MQVTRYLFIFGFPTSVQSDSCAPSPRFGDLRWPTKTRNVAREGSFRFVMAAAKRNVKLFSKNCDSCAKEPQPPWGDFLGRTEVQPRKSQRVPGRDPPRGSLAGSTPPKGWAAICNPCQGYSNRSGSSHQMLRLRLPP